MVWTELLLILYTDGDHDFPVVTKVIRPGWCRIKSGFVLYESETWLQGCGPDSSADGASCIYHYTLHSVFFLIKMCSHDPLLHSTHSFKIFSVFLPQQSSGEFLLWQLQVWLEWWARWWPASSNQLEITTPVLVCLVPLLLPSMPSIGNSSVYLLYVLFCCL